MSKLVFYIKIQGMSDIFILTLYINDLFYIENNEKMIQELKEQMMKIFAMTNFKAMYYFLGIIFNQNERSFHVTEEVCSVPKEI